MAAACAPEPAAAGLPADFAALVPSDAVALLQLRSAREFAAEFESIRVLIAPDAQPVLAHEVLSDALEGALEGELNSVPVDFPGLDSSQPAGLALSMDSSVLPTVLTLILPTSEPEALAALFARGQNNVSATASGTYVAVRIGAGQAPAGEPSALLEDFPPGLISARADLAALLVSYRPLIDIGMVAMAEAMRTEMQSEPTMPFDPAEMVDWYLGVVRGAMDSAERLDLALDLGDARVGLVMSLRSKEGSPLARLSRSERVDYAALAGRLDQDAAALVVACYSQARLLEKFSGMFDAMTQAIKEQEDVPPEVAAAMADYFQAMREIAPRMGREIAISYDIGAGGIRVATDIGAPDPADLASRMTDFMRSPSLATLGILAGPEARGELAGQPAILWKQTIDKERFLKFAQAESLGESNFGELIFGHDGIEMALLPCPKRLSVLAGGDAAWREQAALRLTEGGAADAALLRALEPLAHSNPGMFMRVDFRPFMELGMGAPSASKGPPLRFTLYWGLDGRDLVAGFGTDLESIRSMAEIAN